MLARLGCAALIACASFSTAALAEEPVSRNMEVRFGDLDLTTASGVDTLNRRIATAATKACMATNGYKISDMRAVQACRTIALKQAQPSVELAVNSAKSGKQLAQNTISLPER